MEFFLFLGSLFTPGGSNQKAANGIIHAIDDVIYPYVSEEQATTQRPLPEIPRYVTTYLIRN